MKFGKGAEDMYVDEEGNALAEPVIEEVDGRLGLGAEVGQVLRPTVVPGIRAAVANGDEQDGTK